MEPPKKKRRQAPSLFDDDDDDNDDELCFQPQEVSARRDPGYKLSVKRACADHKLQATMAHIIEKYSHNFEGIGDEIDMETGEIIVNNGHLQSMRDEGDVGGGWMDEGADSDDDDEGIRLEDLTDEFSNNEEENEDAQDSEEDEDSIMKGKEVAEPLNALIANQPTKPNGHDGKLSSLFPSPYSSTFGNPQLGFGASPFAFGASPFAFGNSPLSLGSWAWPGSSSAWGLGPAQVSSHVPSNMLLTTGSDKYEFPAQEGYKSIWASGTGYEEDWISRPAPTIRTGFRKQVAKVPAKPRPQKLLGGPTAKATGDDEDEEDEDAILTGRPSQEHSEANAPVASLSDDEEDDLLLSSSRSLATPPRSSPDQSQDNPISRRHDKQSETDGSSNEKAAGKRKRDATEEGSRGLVKEKKQLVAMKTRKDLPKEVENDSGDRRRSGRSKKQTEFMGKVCWARADGTRKTLETLSVELKLMDPERRKDFQRIDKITNEVEHPMPEAQESSINEPEEEEKEDEQEQEEAINDQSPVEDAAQGQISGRIIPNSQDTGTPLTSSAPQEPQRNTEAPKFPGISNNGIDTTFALSDDEAPIPLPQPRTLKYQKASAENKTNDESREGILNPDVIMPFSDAGNAAMKAAPIALRRPGRPRKIVAASEPEVMPQPAAEELKNAPGEETIQVSVADMSSPKERRKRGRPRKSDISIPVTSPPPVEPIAAEAPIEVAHGDDLNESTMEALVEQELSDIETTSGDAKVPEPVEESQRLRREVKWLRKWRQENPKAAELMGVSDFDPPTEGDELPTKQLRSVKSREVIKPSVEPPSEIRDSQEDSSQPASSNPSSAPDAELPPLVFVQHDPPELSKDTSAVIPTPRLTAKPSSTPRSRRIRDNPNGLPEHPVSSPSSRSKPHTPRHSHIRTSHAPSSRRSILSLLSDEDEDRDELGRDMASLSQLQSSGTTMRKLWRSSALTTEIHRTPVKKRSKDPVSPGSVIKTPGGTTRMCGVDGYRCERDFCFTCL